MGEIDLGSWDLPDTFLPLPQAPPISVKPSLTAQERRALRKGRTVSLHGFADLQAQEDEQIEQLEEEEASSSNVRAQEQEPQRPRSSQSIMSRGRPTSPFESVAASPIAASPVDIPLPASPSPYAARLDEQESDDPNPFALPAPAGPKVSRFDPKSTPHARPTSLASGYFPPPSHPSFQPYPAPAAPLSPTRLRPRTLIMPTPLHGALDPLNSAPSRWDTAQFTHGAKPLPPGALTRPDSFVGQMNAHGKPFDKSRELFRMSLAAGQTVDPHAYGIDVPPIADQEGIIAVRQYGGDDSDSAEDEEEDDPEGWRPETRSLRGLSLMDRLEARKRELKSKNR